MSVSELSDNKDRVESAVLSQSARNDFQSFGELGYNDRLDSLESGSVDSELLGHLDLRGSSSWDDAFVLNETPDNAESVMDGSVGLVQHEVVGSSKKEGNGVSLFSDSGDLEDLSSVGEGFLGDEVGCSKTLWGELVDVGNWGATDSLG